MHTNQSLTRRARRFRRAIKVALAERELSVTELAKRIGKSRNATTRAINRGEFPAVQKLIEEKLL